MKNFNRKKSIVALCVIVPLATVCAFIPKMMRAYNKKKYHSARV